MDESLYQLVLSHYQKGNYENAYHIFNDYLQTHENGLSQKENLLYEECKKQIQNKYLLLINEYIQQEFASIQSHLKNIHSLSVRNNIII